MSIIDNLVKITICRKNNVSGDDITSVLLGDRSSVFMVGYLLGLLKEEAAEIEISYSDLNGETIPVEYGIEGMYYDPYRDLNN